MNIDAPLTLLGGLSPSQFMRRHWQKKPLLVRQAWPGVKPPLTRAAMFALTANPDVESRLVINEQGSWSVQAGPQRRRDFPPLQQAGWTLLLQGLDLHVAAAHQMLQAFRFVPAARLDDLMLSWASVQGGVGPHTDAYDVFLLQTQGRRRWQVGRCTRPAWVADSPLKRLANFEPTLEWVLEAGDMLYLPPQWGHDGVAVDGECMSCSIGFRSPAADELARELLQRLADDGDDPAVRHYRDPDQVATTEPGALPPTLKAFAQQALAARLADPQALARVLGEWATEPKPQVWFEAGSVPVGAQGLAVHARSRMLYDDGLVFINGEAFAASGRDAMLLRKLADQQHLAAGDLNKLSGGARELVWQWAAAGWLETTAHEPEHRS